MSNHSILGAIAHASIQPLLIIGVFGIKHGIPNVYRFVELFQFSVYDQIIKRKCYFICSWYKKHFY